MNKKKQKERINNNLTHAIETIKALDQAAMVYGFKELRTNYNSILQALHIVKLDANEL